MLGVLAVKSAMKSETSVISWTSVAGSVTASRYGLLGHCTSGNRILQILIQDSITFSRGHRRFSSLYCLLEKRSGNAGALAEHATFLRKYTSSSRAFGNKA